MAPATPKQRALGRPEAPDCALNIGVSTLPHKFERFTNVTKVAGCTGTSLNADLKLRRR